MLENLWEVSMMRNLKQLIAEMTLEEKAQLCSGANFWTTNSVERLGIPSIMVTDGPHGLRKQNGTGDHLGLHDSVPATCFPSAVGLASSWDRDLIKEVGIALGKETYAEKVAVLLGPGANIKRSPLCGRNFEYLSEDPYLSSEMATNHVLGVQSQGVGTSLKHFAVNNQEHRRMSVDAVVDERTLREIYLASFEGVVKNAQPWTVMCSYNKVNGTFAAENKRLLTDILREEWGFEGFVVSDWGAVDERVASLAAGLDLEMPSSGEVGPAKVIKAVEAGTLAMEVLDQAVERILTIVFRAADAYEEGAAYNKEEHHQLARKVARESMVLLKNEANILPLSKQSKIALIGEFLHQPRYQGGGSSHVNPTKLDNIYEEIVTAAGASDNAHITYAQGYELNSDESNAELISEAKQVAAAAEVAVLFVGLPDRYESEGYDRSHLRLPDSHIQLIEEISAVRPNIVVVLSNGAPIEMPWIDCVKAVLEGYLGGQALGGAIADILFGNVSPSGRLAETFPKRLSDNPSFLYFPGDADRVEYREGIFVGYRYYDSKNIEPLFPFGHGLSYTKFEYSDLAVNQSAANSAKGMIITVKVTNTGAFTAKEVVQLYVRDIESTVHKADKELKGFAKVELQPGESKVVSLQLDERSFAYYNERVRDWVVEAGEYKILIGHSSRDIRLATSVMIDAPRVADERVHRNSLMGDILTHPVLAPIAMQMMQQMQQDSPLGEISNEDSNADMMQAMMRYMPLRAMVNFSGGAFSDEALDHIIAQLNEALGFMSEVAQK